MEDISDQTLVDSLNIAQSQLARVGAWKELQKTARGSNSLTPFGAINPETEEPFTALECKLNDKYLKLAERFGTIHSIILLSESGKSRKLVEKPPRMLDEEFAGYETRERSTPEFYSLWGELIQLIHIPDEVYIYYAKYTRDPVSFLLSQIADTAVFSTFDYKDDIIIDLATSWRWRRLGRVDKADDMLAKAIAQIDIAWRKDGQRPDMDASPMPSEGVSGQYWLDPWVKGVRGY